MSDTSILHTEDKHQREAKAQKRLQRTILDETARPSIETYFHAYLPGQFVLHTHPIQVVALASQSGWKREVLKIFDPNEVVLVEYATPGLELSLVIKNAVETHKQRYGHIPPMLMLQNHGLIIHEDTIETTVERNTAVLKKTTKALFWCLEDG